MCADIYSYIYTALKGSKAKSNCNKGLCSGLRARDLATSAPSLGFIEDILLMPARVRTLLLVGQQYIQGSSLIDLLEHTHTLSMLISEHNTSNRSSAWRLYLFTYYTSCLPSIFCRLCLHLIPYCGQAVQKPWGYTLDQ